MSVRRLAEESVQPESFAFNADNAAWAEKRIALYPEGRQQSAVIPLLMRAQDQEGWVSRAAIERIADMLGMARIRVLEVATFYTQFQLQPVGTRAHVQVCGTTPCMLRGAEDLRAVCQRKINEHAHETNADGTLSWEEVECMGACVNAPMVAIGRDTYEDLTPERLEEIIDAFAAGEGDSVPTGPQNGRQFSMASTGATTLTDLPARAATKLADAPKAKKSRPAKEEAPKAEATPAEAEVKPAKAADLPEGQLFARPEGAPDDLKLISGVGPVLEKKLNDFGVTRFDQIAAFKKADITALDDGLSFKGRIERDEWVKQAKALAKGVDEYVRVFGKEPK
ncbi:MAG: NADH-quinone oxidoreductase subunit NuoE [Hyphomicrobiaceae bacterium]|nr:NADH-quinone oxidoreductase subunit NuoE [Hyphomicrobiaceae bacterium]MCC0023508.1 NADH-quinone oxidoreductase subunit NuoE [Hyphomicrobiaceae bacterium]